jgi:hypothetical protein
VEQKEAYKDNIERKKRIKNKNVRQLAWAAPKKSLKKEKETKPWPGAYIWVKGTNREEN